MRTDAIGGSDEDGRHTDEDEKREGSDMNPLGAVSQSGGQRVDGYGSQKEKKRRIGRRHDTVTSF